MDDAVNELMNRLDQAGEVYTVSIDLAGGEYGESFTDAPVTHHSPGWIGISGPSGRTLMINVDYIRTIEVRGED